MALNEWSVHRCAECQRENVWQGDKPEMCQQCGEPFVQEESDGS
jgi:DNA-directed RNA polymerase subunit RPC12/RpoP